MASTQAPPGLAAAGAAADQEVQQQLQGLEVAPTAVDPSSKKSKKGGDSGSNAGGQQQQQGGEDGKELDPEKAAKKVGVAACAHKRTLPLSPKSLQ